MATEHIAATEFLNEEYGGAEDVRPHSNNDYTLGRIGVHNNDVTVLLSGEYGTAGAASVARDMLHSFLIVRTGVMVGIGAVRPLPSATFA